jgi:uncharacterized membrane protein
MLVISVTTFCAKNNLKRNTQATQAKVYVTLVALILVSRYVVYDTTVASSDTSSHVTLYFLYCSNLAEVVVTWLKYRKG